METLICPKCNKSLIRRGNSLICEKCGPQCTDKEGINDFLGDADYYWNEIPEKDMNKVLEIAKTKGWKLAIREGVSKEHLSLEYIFTYARVDWLFHCLDYSKTGSCLDIGSGWGSNTFALSHFFSTVWSLEAVKQRIQFQKIRQEQDGISNIKFIRSDWMHLPFPDNYFDLVAVNGVLEWVGLSDYGQNPREMQINFLKEIRRVLKPGGCLYIGIENRFALSYFLGGKDHSGLAYTSIVPRSIADLLVRLSGKGGNYRQDGKMGKWRDYRTYTYGLSGYKKLLKESNYQKVDMYWCPSYNMPNVAGSFEDQSFPFYLKISHANDYSSKNNMSSILSYLGAYTPSAALKIVNRIISPCFLIYAYKESKSASFQTKLIDSEAPGSGYCRGLGGGHGLDSKINYFLLKGGKPFSVMKFARKTGSDLLASEEDKMSRFNNITIKKRIIDSVPIFIEPMLKGSHPHPTNFNQSYKALKWLLNFQKYTQKGFWDYNDFEKRIRGLQCTLDNSLISQDVRQRTQQKLDLFLLSVKSIKLPNTSEHGDYCAINILLDKEKIYVIDWEFFEEDGDPFFDFLFFILSISQYGHNLENFMNNIHGHGQLPTSFEKMVIEFAKENGFEIQLIWQAIPYVILRCLDRATGGSKGRHIRESHFIKMLEIWDKAGSR